MVWRLENEDTNPSRLEDTVRLDALSELQRRRPPQCVPSYRAVLDARFEQIRSDDPREAAAVDRQGGS